MDRDTDVFWGALCGTIVGFIVAKVYETWAILFSRYGVHSGFYFNGPVSTPLWVRASQNPLLVTVVVVILYGTLGVLFVLYLHRRQP